MITYTITMNDGGKSATATIQTPRPLTGEESVLGTKLDALTQLTQSNEQDEYFDLLFSN